MAIKSRAIRRIMPVAEPPPTPWYRRPMPLLVAYFLTALTLVGGLSWVSVYGDPADAAPGARIALDLPAPWPDAGPAETKTAASTGPAQTNALNTEQTALPRPAGVPGGSSGGTSDGTSGGTGGESTPASNWVKIPVTQTEAAPAPVPVAAAAPVPQPERQGRTQAGAPFDPADPRPRIAIVIGGMGLSQRATGHALDTLPQQVTLSFAPHGRELQSWADKAAAKGHEMLLEVPMEPFDYPDNDPGPYTLRTDLPDAENRQRLRWLLDRFTGYQGIVNHLGGRLTADQTAFTAILQMLTGTGLIYLDDGSSHRSTIAEAGPAAGIEWAQADIVLDSPPAASQIETRLAQLERQALSEGSAIGVGLAYPVTVDYVAEWSESLEAKGLVLAPLSAVLATPAGRTARAEN